MGVPASSDWPQTIEFLRKASTQEECLRKVYDILTKKYYGNRLKTLTRIFALFPRTSEAIWKHSGFLHCTNFNRLLRELLLESRHFQKEDIKMRWTVLWGISPHQYVQVRLGDRFVNVDLWAKSYGIPFGEYAHGFYA